MNEITKKIKANKLIQKAEILEAIEKKKLSFDDYEIIVKYLIDLTEKTIKRVEKIKKKRK